MNGLNKGIRKVGSGLGHYAADWADAGVAINAAKAAAARIFVIAASLLEPINTRHWSLVRLARKSPGRFRRGFCLGIDLL